MDEKRSISNPIRDTDQKRNETKVTDGTLDASTSGKTPDGGWADVTQAHYDPAEDHDLTTVIIWAIADAEGVPIVDIKNPPLYEVVDIAGIDNALFGRSEANQNGTDSTMEFRYNGYKVSVEADGWVSVSRRAGDSAADGE